MQGQVLALAVRSDGRILVGGLFLRVNGVDRGNIALLNGDGTLVTDFAASANGGVFALWDSEGDMLAGGDFTQADGIARDRLARFYGSTTIYDLTPPIINCPPGATASATSSSGATVNFTVTATDTFDPSPVIVCTPPSGSVFPRGTTDVSCVARDASGNTSACTFSVTVTPLVFFGSEHVPFGNATLSLSSDGLLISGLSSCGQDGVVIDLHELSRTATLDFGSNGFTLPGLGKLETAAYGTVSGTPGQFLGSVRFENTNGIVSGFWDNPFNWPGGFRGQIEVYDDSTLVGRFPMPEDGSLGTLSGDVRLKAMSMVAEPGQNSFYDWEWFGDWVYTPPGQPSTTLTANRLRLVYVGSSNKIDNLARLILSGCNIPSLLIAGEAAPRFQPELKTKLTGGTLNITWDTRSAVLQSAPTVTGPWSDVVEGTNSFQLAPGEGIWFFRVLVKPLSLP